MFKVARNVAHNIAHNVVHNASAALQEVSIFHGFCVVMCVVMC